jgi:hypothetical protein
LKKLQKDVNDIFQVGVSLINSALSSLLSSTPFLHLDAFFPLPLNGKGSEESEYAVDTP